MNPLPLPPQMAALPKWNAIPVPWIAIWEAERGGPRIALNKHGIEIRSGHEFATMEFGMWCVNVPDNQEGAPLFGQTASARQRKAMLEGLCQICGRSEAESGDTHLWVIPDGIPHVELWKQDLVLNPPVCPSCYGFSQIICPHLIENDPYDIVARKAQEPHSITGDFYHAERGWETIIVPLTDPNRAFVIGRELVMKVTEAQSWA